MIDLTDFIPASEFTPDEIWNYFCDDTKSNDADFIISYSRRLRLEFIIYDACFAKS